VMCSLLERMRRGGATRIRVTTRPEKEDVVELARAEGLEVLLAHPETVTESLLAAVEDVPDQAVALVGFPDTLWEPVDGFVPLVDEVRGGEPVALGLFVVPVDRRCDAVERAADGRVEGVEVAPNGCATGLTWGILAARVSALRGLAGWDEPGRYFDSLARQALVAGVELEGPYEDVGTRAALARLAVRRSGR